MGQLLSTSSDSDRHLKIRSIMGLLASAPTLPLTEWAWRAMFLNCVRHSSFSTREKFVARAAFLAALFHTYSQAEETFYESEASVNLWEGAPLWKIEFLASVLYMSHVCSTRNVSSESLVASGSRAALCSLVFQLPTAINSLRFAYTTVHDSNRMVSKRLLQVPVISHLKTSSLAFAFTFVCGWLSIPVGGMARAWVEENYGLYSSSSSSGAIGFARLVSNSLDSVHENARVGSIAYSASLTGLVAPMLGSFVRSTAQLAAFEGLNRPTLRSLTLLTIACVRTVLLKGHAQQTRPPTGFDKALFLQFAGCVVGVQQTLIAMGEPEKHAPFGKRQSIAFRSKHETHDSGFFAHREPVENAIFDYEIESSAELELRKRIKAKEHALEDVRFSRRALLSKASRLVETIKQAPPSSISPRASSYSTDAEVSALLAAAEAQQALSLRKLKLAVDARIEDVSAKDAKLEEIERKVTMELDCLLKALAKRETDASGVQRTARPSVVGDRSEWYVVRGVQAPKAVENSRIAFATAANVLSLLIAKARLT